jgi:tRNA-splicing ligase RtcB (3'-phosphate/5'-hydroxy nucleic acid ligase)
MHNSTIKTPIYSPEIEGKVTEIEKIKGIKKPVVILPDAHTKNHLEGPSSIVVTAEGVIIPNILPPTLGCGMGIIKTNLNRKDVGKKTFDKFFSSIKDGIVFEKSSTLNNILHWFGLRTRKTKEYDFNESELEEVIKNGASKILSKYSLPENTIKNIENEGGLNWPEEIEYDSIIPRSAKINSRHNLGYGFGGNHFLEIGFVERIVDQTLATDWGLKEGQIVIGYHGGEGRLGFYLGRYFGNRKKFSFKDNLLNMPGKIFFHFFSLDGLKNFFTRLEYYFFKNNFKGIPADTYEGKRRWASAIASANYSYANRMVMFRRIIDAFNKANDDKKVEYNLLWDSNHESLFKEEDLFIHRSGATAVQTGKPVIISGFNTTNSYIGVGLKNESADHGAGETIKKRLKETSKHAKGYKTWLYNRKRESREVEHITNEGLNFVINTLERDKIVKPVALLRPLATLNEKE